MIFVKIKRLMFKTQILADKLTHLTDARYFAARDVDIVCFSIDENEDLMKAGMSINAMKAWIEGPKIFLRPGFRNADEILELCASIQPEALICSFIDESFQLQDLPCKLFLDFTITNDDSIYYATSFIHTYKPVGIVCELNNKEIFNSNVFKDFLNTMPANIEVFIKPELDQEQIQTILDTKISGLAIDGSTEEKLGMKTFDEIDQFLDALEV